MSDSVRPQRWQHTRLPRPWDSPGKNTGVGCHFLLQCMKVKRESEVAQSCPTPSNPMDCSPPGSSIHGIFQASVLEWVPLPSPMWYILVKNNANVTLILLKKYTTSLNFHRVKIIKLFLYGVFYFTSKKAFPPWNQIMIYKLL